MSEAFVPPKPNEIMGLDGKVIRARAPAFDEEVAYKNETFRRLGDLDDIELLFNDVLVAKYISLGAITLDEECFNQVDFPDDGSRAGLL